MRLNIWNIILYILFLLSFYFCHRLQPFFALKTAELANRAIRGNNFNLDLYITKNYDEICRELRNDLYKNILLENKSIEIHSYTF